METWFTTQSGNGEFHLQFGTHSKEQYELMQFVARACVDHNDAHLRDLIAAEKDGQLYNAHDVAVILASAIGDDCACNINSIFVNTDARNTESVVSLKTCKSDAIPFWTN